MALGWITLAADECEPMILCPGDKAIYRLAELRLLGHRAVQRVTFSVVVLIILGAPAELFPKKQVPDASLPKGTLEGLAVELGSDARVRVRPHVRNELNPLVPQERRERLKRVVRVPDCPDSSLSHSQ
jgi:hypothetical protein